MNGLAGVVASTGSCYRSTLIFKPLGLLIFFALLLLGVLYRSSRLELSLDSFPMEFGVFCVAFAAFDLSGDSGESDLSPPNGDWLPYLAPVYVTFILYLDSSIFLIFLVRGCGLAGGTMPSGYSCSLSFLMKSFSIFFNAMPLNEVTVLPS